MRVKFMKWEDVTFHDLSLDSDINISDGYSLAEPELADNGLGHFYWWRDATQKLNWAMPRNHEDNRRLCSSLRYSMASEDTIDVDAWLKSNLADQFEDSRKAYALRHNEGVISMLRRNNYPIL